MDQSAVDFAKARGLPVQQVNDIAEFADGCEQKFDLIVMNHVLEHLPKDQMVATLALVRKRLLRPGGHFFLAVPNAQANTGCYWAYEDFTHTYLFTAGSLQFVLRAAGFQQIEFVDPDCTNYLSAPKKVVRKALLGLYKANYNFWNRVTQSSFYEHSPQIFSYEIKVLARSPNS